MKKIIVLSFLLVFMFDSCKTAEEKVEKLEIAKKYYEVLNNSDETVLMPIIGDSILIRESEDDYEENFSRQGYIDWLNWDAVFDPTYKVIEIEQQDSIVKAKISKTDKRIIFLHEKPMIWNEIIRFDKNKIVKVERVKYEVFDVPKFLENRALLVNWIDENHPELKGFLFDQTPSGGKKYLKAMALFEKRK